MNGPDKNLNFFLPLKSKKLCFMYPCSSSFILHLFGGFEKHVLPRFIIEKTGTPFSFIPLKIAILLPILYYLNKSKEKEFSKLILIAAFALGFAQGLRNLINVLLI